MKILLAFLFSSFGVLAITIKVAAIAPKGTNWANTIEKMVEEIKTETKSRVKFKVYYGGIAGDEPDVLRKIRVSQLHGAVFTGNTLGAIYSDSRVIEIPFNFLHDQDKAKKALDTLEPILSKGFLANGFVNLGFYEVGLVYVVSTKRFESIEQMRGVKVWSWEGDKLIDTMIQELKLVSVPLSLPDVLSSLSTGIIQAAYAPPMGILALQWQNQIKYLVDFPSAYSIAALLIDDKQWRKLKAEDQLIVRQVSKKYIDQANVLARSDNEQGMILLKNKGVEFVKFNQSDINKASVIRQGIINKLSPKYISKSILEKLERLR